jgi:hypothetical protein
LSVAVVHDQDHAGPAAHDARERLVVVAAVVATLAVIAGPGIVAALGLVSGIAPGIVEPPLTTNAQRVLDEVPSAYETGGMVVVPAVNDPNVVWIGAVTDDGIDGAVVDLGVNGLVAYGSLPRRGTPPAWMSELTPEDAVFSDVGSLYFACTPSLAADSCHGSVLVLHQGRWHVWKAGLGKPGSTGQVTRLGVLGSGGDADVWLGWMPPRAATVWATVVGNQYIRDVPARATEQGAVGGGAMWWVRSSEPVSAVTFRDRRGRVLDRVAVGD